MSLETPGKALWQRWDFDRWLIGLSKENLSISPKCVPHIYDTEERLEGMPTPWLHHM